MTTVRKLAKIAVAAGLGLALWTALPSSPISTVAGSSLNVRVHINSPVMSPLGSSLN